MTPPIVPYRYVAKIYERDDGFYVEMELPLCGKIIRSGPFMTRQEADADIDELRRIVETVTKAHTN